LTPGWCTAR